MLGWETLQQRRVCRKLCILFETLKTKSPNHLYYIIEKQLTVGPRNGSNLRPFRSNKPVFRKSFFPSTIKAWNLLDSNLKNATSKANFKNKIINKIRPKCQSFYGLSEFTRVKYLTTLRLDHSHLRAHKFLLGFVDTNDNKCITCRVTEDTNHFFLLCRRFIPQREALRRDLLNLINIDLADPQNELAVVKLLLFGGKAYSFSINTQILTLSTNYISSTGRLDWHPPP